MWSITPTGPVVSVLVYEMMLGHVCQALHGLRNPLRARAACIAKCASWPLGVSSVWGGSGGELHWAEIGGWFYMAGSIDYTGLISIMSSTGGGRWWVGGWVWVGG